MRVRNSQRDPVGEHESGRREPHHGRRLDRRVARPRVYVMLILVTLSVAARLAAPTFIRHAINDRLSRIPEYDGHVQDVDLALLRGAYAVEGVELRKEGGTAGAPLLTASRIDLAVAWRDLFRGRISSEIHIEHSKITFVRTDSEQTSQTGADTRWQEAIQNLFPITISRFSVERADVQFVDQTREPHIDISLHDVGLLAEGLRNRRAEGSADQLPARVDLWGKTVGDGSVRMTMRVAPLEVEPLFDLELSVERLPLPAYNSLLRAYGNIDVSHGFFDLALEVAARGGGFEGYVKPFFRELEFENITDKQRPMLSRLWESIVNAMKGVLKNPESRRVGTRVPFSGSFENPQIGTWSAVINAVRYGFGTAFSERIENTVEPSDVQPPGPDRPESRDAR